LRVIVSSSWCYTFIGKGYTDYNWWKDIDDSGAYFVTRLKYTANVKELSEIQVTS